MNKQTSSNLPKHHTKFLQRRILGCETTDKVRRLPETRQVPSGFKDGRVIVDAHSQTFFSYDSQQADIFVTSELSSEKKFGTFNNYHYLCHRKTTICQQSPEK